MKRRPVLVTVLFVALFVLGWWVGRGGAAGRSDLYKNLDVFVEVVQRVQQSYVDPVDPTKLVNGALKGLTRSLDPYSQYLDAKAYEGLQAVTHGSFGGVGLVVGIRDGAPVVVSPIEGGPAWTLGIAAGDVIVRIDGQSTNGLALEDVAQRLRGDPGTHVQLGIRREGDNDDREFSIERNTIVTKSVPYSFVLPDHVGYLRLADFSEDASGEVRLALSQLRKQGATRLVLDLRSNPGGLLDQAVDIVEQFVRTKTLVVYTQGRTASSDQRYYANEPKPELGWPLVVLVDRGTASASEIVTGAIQDLDRGLVVGETSFGKGLVQSVFPLRGRGALKLTTARYYTPSGRCINSLASEHMLDSLDAVADGGDGSDGEASTPANADSADRPKFRTAAGRTVYGGGGIRPEVTVVADSLPALTQRIEARASAFRFANRWINTHKGWTLDQPPTDEMRLEFRAMCDSMGAKGTLEEWQSERPWLDRALRRELARRLGGDAAAARVAFETDPVLARALAVLGRARNARDVFAVSSEPSPTPAATPALPPARQAAGAHR